MQPVKVIKIKTKKEVIKEPYPGWKKQATTVDAPTAEDKKREKDMSELLEKEKENFYGKGKPAMKFEKKFVEKRKLDEIGKRAISDRKSEEVIKRANALIAAKVRADKEKKK